MDCLWKYHLQMDDDWGYPLFWSDPHCRHSRCRSLCRCRFLWPIPLGWLALGLWSLCGLGCPKDIFDTSFTVPVPFCEYFLKSIKMLHMFVREDCQDCRLFLVNFSKSSRGARDMQEVSCASMSAVASTSTSRWASVLKPCLITLSDGGATSQERGEFGGKETLRRCANDIQWYSVKSQSLLSGLKALLELSNLYTI